MRLQRSLIVVAALALTGANPPPKGSGDITKALSFSNVKNCVFSPATQKIFDALLKRDRRGKTFSTAPKVSIGGANLWTKRTVTAKDDVERGAKVYNAEISFPPSVRWNGLRIARIGSATSNYTEIDNFDEVYLAFHEPPAKVVAVLKRLGATVPLAPKYQELDDGACGGAMSLSALKDGTLLDCNWGC